MSHNILPMIYLRKEHHKVELYIINNLAHNLSCEDSLLAYPMGITNYVKI